MEELSVKEINDYLYEKYETLLLNEIQLSKEVNRSIPSLRLDRQKGVGITFVKEGKNNGSIRYSILDVGQYIFDNRQNCKPLKDIE